eukprot:m.50327 g.50327  ORF g.50327 m.50327 type:complete len:1217 (+) comp7505_c0_seq2:324-3974(+)
MSSFNVPGKMLVMIDEGGKDMNEKMIGLFVAKLLSHVASQHEWRPMWAYDIFSSTTSKQLRHSTDTREFHPVSTESLQAFMRTLSFPSTTSAQTASSQAASTSSVDVSLDPKPWENLISRFKEQLLTYPWGEQTMLGSYKLANDRGAIFLFISIPSDVESLQRLAIQAGSRSITEALLQQDTAKFCEQKHISLFIVVPEITSEIYPVATLLNKQLSTQFSGALLPMDKFIFGSESIPIRWLFPEGIGGGFQRISSGKKAYTVAAPSSAQFLSEGSNNAIVSCTGNVINRTFPLFSFVFYTKDFPSSAFEKNTDATLISTIPKRAYLQHLATKPSSNIQSSTLSAISAMTSKILKTPPLLCTGICVGSSIRTRGKKPGISSSTQKTTPTHICCSHGTPTTCSVFSSIMLLLLKENSCLALSQTSYTGDVKFFVLCTVSPFQATLDPISHQDLIDLGVSLDAKIACTSIPNVQCLCQKEKEKEDEEDNLADPMLHMLAYMWGWPRFASSLLDSCLENTTDANDIQIPVWDNVSTQDSNKPSSFFQTICFEDHENSDDDSNNEGDDSITQWKNRWEELYFKKSRKETSSPQSILTTPLSKKSKATGQTTPLFHTPTSTLLSTLNATPPASIHGMKSSTTSSLSSKTNDVLISSPRKQSKPSPRINFSKFQDLSEQDSITTFQAFIEKASKRRDDNITDMKNVVQLYDTLVYSKKGDEQINLAKALLKTLIHIPEDVLSGVTPGTSRMFQVHALLHMVMLARFSSIPNLHTLVQESYNIEQKIDNDASKKKTLSKRRSRRGTLSRRITRRNLSSSTTQNDVDQDEQIKLGMSTIADNSAGIPTTPPMNTSELMEEQTTKEEESFENAAVTRARAVYSCSSSLEEIGGVPQDAFEDVLRYACGKQLGNMLTDVLATPQKNPSPFSSPTKSTPRRDFSKLPVPTFGLTSPDIDHGEGSADESTFYGKHANVQKVPTMRNQLVGIINPSFCPIPPQSAKQIEAQAKKKEKKKKKKQRKEGKRKQSHEDDSMKRLTNKDSENSKKSKKTSSKKDTKTSLAHDGELMHSPQRKRPGRNVLVMSTPSKRPTRGGLGSTALDYRKEVHGTPERPFEGRRLVPDVGIDGGVCRDLNMASSPLFSQQSQVEYTDEDDNDVEDGPHSVEAQDTTSMSMWDIRSLRDSTLSPQPGTEHDSFLSHLNEEEMKMLQRSPQKNHKRTNNNSSNT